MTGEIAATGAVTLRAGDSGGVDAGEATAVGEADEGGEEESGGGMFFFGMRGIRPPEGLGVRMGAEGVESGEAEGGGGEGTEGWGGVGGVGRSAVGLSGFAVLVRGRVGSVSQLSGMAPFAAGGGGGGGGAGAGCFSLSTAAVTFFDGARPPRVLRGGAMGTCVEGAGGGGRGRRGGRGSSISLACFLCRKSVSLSLTASAPSSAMYDSNTVEMTFCTVPFSRCSTALGSIDSRDSRSRHTTDNTSTAVGSVL